MITATWYLGLEQLFDPNLKIVRNTLAKIATNRVGKVAQSLLSGKNKSALTNSWIMAKLRYYLAAVRWSKRELILLDRVIRRKFQATASCHSNAAVERFHIGRSEGGRGIGSALQIYEQVQVSAAVYLVSTKNKMMEAVVSHQMELPKKRRSVLSEATEVVRKYDVAIELHIERNELAPKTAVIMVKTA